MSMSLFTTYQAMISYSRHDDMAFVEKLQNSLETVFQIRSKRSRRYFWRDLTDMPSQGRGFRQEIKDAIDASERVLLIVGEKAMTSPEVRMEWEYALSICKPIVPLLRAGDWSLLPTELANLPGYDFRDDMPFDERLNQLTGVMREQPLPLGKLVNVTSLPAQFQPRPVQLASVKASLLRDVMQPIVDTSPTRKVGMHGMGGIGKSILASAVVHDCDIRRSYPDGIIWINLGQEPNLATRLADVCRALGDGPSTMFADIDSGRSRLSELIASRQALLVLDDLWSLEHANAFNFSSPRSSMLVTTRIENLLDEIGAIKHQVDILTETEALRLMARHLSPPDFTSPYNEPEQIRRLDTMVTEMPPDALAVARECGYLPLALVISASHKRKGIPWKSLLNALQTTTSFAKHPNGTVLKTIDVSVKALEQEQPGSEHRYQQLAIFPEDMPIPDATLMTLWVDEDFSQFEAQVLTSELITRALVIPLIQGEERRFRLHDLQQDYVRLTLPDWHVTNERLIQRYREQCSGPWHMGPNDGYFFERLSYHLRTAGRKHELYGLLTETPDWMETKFVATGSDNSYVWDIRQGIECLENPLNADAISVLCRLHAAKCVVGLRTSAFLDLHLEALSLLGRSSEAVSLSHLRTNVKARFDGLMAIQKIQIEIGEKKAIPDLLNTAQHIESPELRASSLIQVLGTLILLSQYEANLVEICTQILDISANIETTEVQLPILRDFIKALRSVDDSSDIGPFVDRALSMALNIRYRIDNENENPTTVSGTGSALIKLLSEQTENELETAKNELETAKHKLETASLGALESLLNYANYSRNNREKNKRTSETFLELSELFFLGGWHKEAEEIIRRNLELTRQLSDLDDLVPILGSLAVQLSDLGEPELAIQIINEAISKVNISSNTQIKSNLQAKLVEVLIRLRVPEKALSLIQQIDDNVLRAQALSHIALFMASDNKVEQSVELTETLVQITQGVTDPRKCSSLFQTQAILFAHQKKYDAAVDSLVKSIQLGNQGWNTDLTDYGLDDVDEDATYAGMLNMAEDLSSILNTFTAGISASRNEADLFEIVANSTIAGASAHEAAQVLDKLYQTTANRPQREESLKVIGLAFRKLGQYEKAHSIFTEILASAQIAENSEIQDDALKAYVSILVRNEYFELAQTVSQTIEDTATREQALYLIVKGLLQKDHLEHAVRVAQSIRGESPLSDALHEIAKKLVELGNYDSAIKIARTISQPWDRAFALSNIGLELAKIRDEAGIHKWTLLGYFRLHRPKALFNEALTAARSTRIPEQRGLSLGIVAGNLYKVGWDTWGGQVLSEGIKWANGFKGIFFAAALNKVAVGLVRTQQQFKRAIEFELIVKARDGNRYTEEIANEFLRIDRPDEALLFARDIETRSEKAKLIQEIGKRFARNGQPQLALEMAHDLGELGETDAADNVMAWIHASQAQYTLALDTLVYNRPSEYIRTLIEWNDFFDRTGTRLSFTMLRQVISISGWLSQPWHHINELLPLTGLM